MFAATSLGDVREHHGRNESFKQALDVGREIDRGMRDLASTMRSAGLSPEESYAGLQQVGEEIGEHADKHLLSDQSRAALAKADGLQVTDGIQVRNGKFEANPETYLGSAHEGSLSKEGVKLAGQRSEVFGVGKDKSFKTGVKGLLGEAAKKLGSASSGTDAEGDEAGGNDPIDQLKKAFGDICSLATKFAGEKAAGNMPEMGVGLDNGQSMGPRFPSPGLKR